MLLSLVVNIRRNNSCHTAADVDISKIVGRVILVGERRLLKMSLSWSLEFSLLYFHHRLFPAHVPAGTEPQVIVFIVFGKDVIGQVVIILLRFSDVCIPEVEWCLLHRSVAEWSDVPPAYRACLTGPRQEIADGENSGENDDLHLDFSFLLLRGSVRDLSVVRWGLMPSASTAVGFYRDLDREFARNGC